LLRSIIVSDLKSSPDMLDEALNHSNKIIKEIIDLSSKMHSLSDTDFENQIEVMTGKPEWKNRRQWFQRFNTDLVFYSLFILGLIFLLLSILNLLRSL